jgi:DNA-binding MarR family transcriptional regulator/N-acetylglutamate synthase-like GNAT family acetyltransferase
MNRSKLQVRPEQVRAVRRFSRFYTQRIGVLNHGLLESPYSLTEVRLLYELAHRDHPTAAEIKKDLNLDAGYLSRLLRRFERRRWVRRETSTEDARRRPLVLTKKGRSVFLPLDRRADEEVRSTLALLPAQARQAVMRAMGNIEHLLQTGAKAGPRQNSKSFSLRPPEPGDMGWVIHRHGVVYAREYGWDERFEALVAEIVAKFMRTFDAARERCWVAEMNGDRVGCVFVVKERKTVAKLRLLLVEPHARGRGIGLRLVRECIEFARQAGYRKLRLWTNSVLESARRIYEATGFKLVAEKRHREFGRELVGQTWEMALR